MSLLDAFKLEKLKILAFTDRERTSPAQPREFVAMFNPETLKQRYAVVYTEPAGIGASDDRSVYSRSEPSDLDLELHLDGTGVTDSVVLPPGPAAKTVAERVEEFLAVAYYVEGEIHRPNFLQVQWGDLWTDGGFNCRLLSVDITYTRFQRDGKPLRAQLDVKLRSDTDYEDQVRKINPQSPDLTHRHVVRAGETLPQLTARMYGDAAHVAFVARENGLDSLRSVTPGTELFFPPLAPGQRAKGKTP